MVLPDSLQQKLTEHITVNKAVRAAFETMNTRYRSNRLNQGLHTAAEASAYAITRLPATYAVLRHLMDAIKDDQISSILDIGAGPGQSVWAAHDRWPDLKRAILIEPDAHMYRLQQHLLQAAPVKTQCYKDKQFQEHKADLVISSYVLNELPLQQQQQIADKAWQSTNKYLLLIYPGAHRYFDAFVNIRQQIITAGGSIIAPCPHMLDCPLDKANDWCHFSIQLNRSKQHRDVKEANLSHEDEKFSYLIASKSETHNKACIGRIVKKPIIRKGHTVLDICTSDAKLERTTITKSDPNYKSAKKLVWGDIATFLPTKENHYSR